MQAGLVSKRLSFREIFMAAPRMILCVLVLVRDEVSPCAQRRLSMAA